MSPKRTSHHPRQRQRQRQRETKRRGGDETRPVRARYSIDCFLPPAAPLPPQLLPPPPARVPRCPSQPAATGGERESGSRAPRRSFPSPTGGRPRRGSRTGRPRNGRPR
ncbi:hypothetical protein ZWY2020_019807 [Hordeum vulgare]|nr:hypothetical protein ZWY2020_019807 [Hordeum vulgare]